MIECPLCPKTFVSWRKAGRHLLGCHRQDARLTPVPPGHVRCWCGHECSMNRLGRHLQKMGGPAAHLLEYLL